MSAPTSNQIPKCRLCGKNHFAREGCKFESVREGFAALMTHAVLKRMESRDTPREGRRVLKGSTGKVSPAKPTRTASTEKANPPTPAKAPAKQTIAEKVRPGKPKTAPRKRKKKSKGRTTK